MVIAEYRLLSSANDWHVSVDISLTLLLPLHLLNVRWWVSVVSSVIISRVSIVLCWCWLVVKKKKKKKKKKKIYIKFTPGKSYNINS